MTQTHCRHCGADTAPSNGSPYGDSYCGWECYRDYWEGRDPQFFPELRLLQEAADGHRGWTTRRMDYSQSKVALEILSDAGKIMAMVLYSRKNGYGYHHAIGGFIATDVPGVIRYLAIKCDPVSDDGEDSE